YLFSYSFRLIGIWNASTEGNFLLRKKQYDYNDWTIAKKLVENKISNQLSLLVGIRQKTLSCRDAIDTLKRARKAVLERNELKEILGTEGLAARVFFENWFDNVDWSGRRPRTKIDPINVILDIGYTYLFAIIEGMLNLYGFDIYSGV